MADHNLLRDTDMFWKKYRYTPQNHNLLDFETIILKLIPQKGGSCSKQVWQLRNKINQI